MKRLLAACGDDSPLAAYWERIAADVGIARPLKVVVDAGNGTGGAAGVPLFKRMGCQVVELFCDMDGNFPNHHPDPTVPAFMQSLIATVKAEKADIGIAFDGDGDRIGVVDERARSSGATNFWYFTPAKS